jgi:type IV secretion system protein VirD4
MRAMKNYAGHRLSPWLGHLMVSRQETARPLLTPGEVMQLPPSEELVLVSGCPPIRATKARYYEDNRLTERVVPPPPAVGQGSEVAASDDWSRLSAPVVSTCQEARSSDGVQIDDPANGGIRREPELLQHEEILPVQAKSAPEFAFVEEDPDDDAVRARALRQQISGLARQVTMDPGDGVKLSE